MSKKYFEELSISVEQNFDINKDGLLDFFEDQKTLQITGRHSISYERILVCNGYLLDNDNVFDQADSISGDLCRVCLLYTSPSPRD